MAPDDTLHDRIAPDDPDLLAAIADHGGRLCVLRQLEAGGAMAEMDARDIASEVDLSVDASRDTIAEVFADAWPRWYADAMPADEQAYWVQFVEARYGDRADAVLADAGRDAEVRDA